MIEATLASLRNLDKFYNADEILHIYDGRKKDEIGYFVPKYFQKEFEEFVQTVEKKKKLNLLKRIRTAQIKDPIEEGSETDGF